MNDITTIINKLYAAGYAEKHDKGYCGQFNTDEHGYVLSAPELETWLNLLHEAADDDDRCCTDIHDWNIDIAEEN